MSQPQEGAVEVNDIASAAQEIERRMTEAEAEPSNDEEVIQNEDESTDVEESETEAPETESEEEEATEEEEQGETEHTFETVNDLAEATGMELDKFLSTIKIARKVNGQEELVTLEELKNGNQLYTDYQRKTTEIAEQRKVLETQQEAARAELATKLQQVESVLNADEQALLQEYNGINWTELEESEPEQWAIKRQKFQERYQQLQGQKQFAQEESKRIQLENQAKQQEQYQAYLQKEQLALLDKLPSWSNKETASKEQAEITNFLKNTYGYSDNEIAQAADHRIVLMARDAMKARQTTEKTDLAKKMVKKLPPVLKPGVKQSKQELKAKSSNDKLTRFKKTGKREDLVSALIDRM